MKYKPKHQDYLDKHPSLQHSLVKGPGMDRGTYKPKPAGESTERWEIHFKSPKSKALKKIKK